MNELALAARTELDAMGIPFVNTNIAKKQLIAAKLILAILKKSRLSNKDAITVLDSIKIIKQRPEILHRNSPNPWDVQEAE